MTSYNKKNKKNGGSIRCARFIPFAGIVTLFVFLAISLSWKDIGWKKPQENVSPLHDIQWTDTRLQTWLGYDTSKRSPPPVQIRGLKEDAKLLAARTKGNYQGGGEPEHVGGFMKNDPQSFEEKLWTWMVDVLNGTSMIDVGCGRGVSTKWFLDKGLDVTCVEGSPSGVKTTEVPGKVIEHDYTKGPWWNHEKTYDFAWSCEFLEHVDVEYVANYMATFSRARLVFATHSIWGGWHHALLFVILGGGLSFFETTVLSLCHSSQRKQNRW